MNPVQLQWKFPKYNLRTNPFLFQNFSNTGPYGAMTKHDMWKQVPFTSQHAQPILELTPATTHSLPASPVHAWVDTFHTSLSQYSDICSCVTILNSYLFLTPQLCHPHIMYKNQPITRLGSLLETMAIERLPLIWSPLFTRLQDNTHHSPPPPPWGSQWMEPSLCCQSRAYSSWRAIFCREI